MRPETTNARERDFFKLLTQNRFSVLNQDLQTANNTETSFNHSAPEYVPIANRQLKQKVNTNDQKYMIENTTTDDTNRSNVKAPLICSDITNKTTGQKVRQCKNPQGENHNNQVVYD